MEFDKIARAAKNLENEARQGKFKTAAQNMGLIETELIEIGFSLASK